jgi:Ricin-type beta-trefoil lectin domain-like
MSGPFTPNNTTAALFAAAITITAGLAAAPAAQANPAISFFTLQSNSNGMCLQPVNGSTNAGDAIVQEPCVVGSFAQVWTSFGTSPTSGTNRFFNPYSGMCLDARGGPTNGTPIQQFPCGQITNQAWQDCPAHTVVAKCPLPGAPAPYLASGVSGTFTFCIATPGDQAGLPMELHDCLTDDEAQFWSRPVVGNIPATSDAP